MSGAQLLLVAAPGLPLALTILVLIPRARPALFRLLPLAPLPALAAALVLPPGVAVSFPQALLGAGMTLSELARIFLGVAALLWTLAASYACATVDHPGRGRFAGFWLATLTGNLLLFVVADAVSFYLAFAILSLAAFGLIVHTGTDEARRAGRIYLVLAVAGETCLLMGLLIGAHAAQSVVIIEVLAALAAAPQRDLALALLVAGFGLKAGLVPLHVWLPLAHPAAPVPASAVLSGAIVKAGIYGLVSFLPLEAVLGGWSLALVAIGLLTTYLGVVFGIVQRRAKTVLAYSTLSQMGLVVAVIGSGLAGPGAGLALAAATLYAAHHGLAKGALFLSVGVIAHSGGSALRPVLAVAAITALAVAGLPLTGGALAKLAIKGPIGAGPAALLVTLSAVGTTLLMLRYLQLVRRTAPAGEERPRTALLAPFVVCAVAALAVPWLLFPELSGSTVAYALKPANLWGALWPILAGVAVLVGALRLRRHPEFRIPEGDLVVLAERAVQAASRHTCRCAVAWPRPDMLALAARLAASLERADSGLSRLRLTAVTLLVLVLLVFGAEFSVIWLNG